MIGRCRARREPSPQLQAWLVAFCLLQQPSVGAGEGQSEARVSQGLSFPVLLDSGELPRAKLQDSVPSASATGLGQSSSFPQGCLLSPSPPGEPGTQPQGRLPATELSLLPWGEPQAPLFLFPGQRPAQDTGGPLDFTHLPPAHPGQQQSSLNPRPRAWVLREVWGHPLGPGPQGGGPDGQQVHSLDQEGKSLDSAVYPEFKPDRNTHLTSKEKQCPCSAETSIGCVLGARNKPGWRVLRGPPRAAMPGNALA